MSALDRISACTEQEKHNALAFIAGYRPEALDRALGRIESQRKPPRIPEPGLWGVVEASVGKDGRYKFVRAFEANWMCTADSSVYPWLELIDPTLVREGLS